MDSSTLGKAIIFLGIGLIVVGGIIWAAAKWGLPFGQLPGDVKIQGAKTTVFFPIVTCIVISLFLTLLVNCLLWFFRK
jgi:hypothetical protein